MNEKMNYMLIGLVVFLLVFSVAQAFQISDLKNGIDSGEFSAASKKNTPVQQNTKASGSVPTMVGGC